MRCFWLMLTREYTLSQYDSSPPLTACKILVTVINSSFVEQVEEPGIYLSKYWFFWKFGIQYKVDNLQFSSFIGIFSDDMNDLWFAKTSSLSKLVCCVYQSSWKYQVLPIARLWLNNNHSLHYLFTKPYFLWFFNIFMMFTYLKLSMFVSSTGQNENCQEKYYHLVSVVCYP